MATMWRTTQSTKFHLTLQFGGSAEADLHICGKLAINDRVYISNILLNRLVPFALFVLQPVQNNSKLHYAGLAIQLNTRVILHARTKALGSTSMSDLTTGFIENRNRISRNAITFYLIHALKGCGGDESQEDTIISKKRLTIFLPFLSFFLLNFTCFLVLFCWLHIYLIPAHFHNAVRFLSRPNKGDTFLYFLYDSLNYSKFD